MSRFTYGYLALGLIVLALELYGIFRQGDGADTISEHWWWLQGRFPIGSRIFYVAGVTWLSIHFMFHKVERPPSIEPAVELVVIEETP